MNPEITRYKNRLDELFKRVGQYSSDIYMQAQWTRYLCILVSGFLETALQSMYSEYAQKMSHPNVANYVYKELQYFQNAKMGKIFELVSAFSKDWNEQLEKDIDERIKGSINSIVSNRNKIAHGEDTQLSYHQLEEYYKDVVKLVQLLYNQCNSS